MPESTLSPALAYTYCDQRCERCPLQSECEVAAASGGDQPLPAPDGCHCTACRKHSGHYFVSTDVPRSALVVHGEDRVV